MALNFKNFGGGEGGEGRSRFFIFAGVLILMVVATLWTAGWWRVRQLNGPEQKAQAEAYKTYQSKVEEAYKNDTYGGATPEETLRLFIEALKKEDIELASKYFALDDNLGRGEWSKHLLDLKNRNLLSLMVRDIESKARPDVKNRLYENDYKFVLYTDDGLIGAEINMEFNPVSKVWKIESL